MFYIAQPTNQQFYSWDDWRNHKSINRKKSWEVKPMKFFLRTVEIISKQQKLPFVFLWFWPQFPKNKNKIPEWRLALFAGLGYPTIMVATWYFQSPPLQARSDVENAGAVPQLQARQAGQGRQTEDVTAWLKVECQHGGQPFWSSGKKDGCRQRIGLASARRWKPGIAFSW